MRTISIKNLDVLPYQPVYQAMRRFTAARDQHSRDELWCLQHQPVFTLGLSGRREHLLTPGAVPVVPTDRGGQVTYHGPGQLVSYTLLDLHRKALTIKGLVHLLEQSVIDLLQGYGVQAARRSGAPGVYVASRKIAALGLRVRRGYCYHGVAINVDMDLTPFTHINPCGQAGLQVTQLADFAAYDNFAIVRDRYQACLSQSLKYRLDYDLDDAPAGQGGRARTPPCSSRQPVRNTPRRI